MKSRTTAQFRHLYRQLPADIRQAARQAYRLWQANPQHPGLRFKRVGVQANIYSVRIGLNWRALALVEGDLAIWWWVGSHADYDALLKAKR